MRTTLSLDDDVAADLRRIQQETQKPWKRVVNEVLRAGVAALAEADRRSRPMRRTRPVSLGKPLVGDIANVHEVLSLAEGDARR